MKTILLFLITFNLFSIDKAYKSYDAFLKKYVSNGKVDYKGIKEDKNFDSILKEFSDVTATEYKNFSEPEKISFLINAYNAFTIKLIINYYPIKSIRKIGILPLAAWREKFFSLLGKETNLDFIEHEKLRKDFEEPRIHFAIVCASIGCPPLISEAFTSDKLEQQLKTVRTNFIKDKTKNRFDKEKNTLYISEIFKWFEKDFTKKSTIPKFISESLGEEIPENVEIEYTYYDWNLNEKK